MGEHLASRRVASVLALASGLWISGCAATEAEGTDEPGIAYTAGAVLGQVVSGFFTGFFAGLAGQPQYAGGGTGYSPDYVYPSATSSTGYGHKVHHPPHHHHHRHR